jgi:hypothetical protein
VWADSVVKKYLLDITLEKRDAPLACDMIRKQSHDMKPEPCSLRDCFRLLEETETLEGDNKWYCNKCA